MTGRRKDKGKDVKDVYFPSERIAGDDVHDYEVAAVLGEASPGRGQVAMGEFVSEERTKKPRNRKKTSHSKRRGAAGSSPGSQVVSLDRQSLDASSGRNAAGESENGELVGNLESDLHTAGSDAKDSTEVVANELDHKDGIDNGVDSKAGDDENPKEIDVNVKRQMSRGEESILSRLKRIIARSTPPALSTEAANSNLLEQSDEILALEAIYGQDFGPFSHEQIRTPCFMLTINVELGGNITLWVDQPSSSKSGEKKILEDGKEAEEGNVKNFGHEFTVEFLPPLRLLYTLPLSYPSESPPLFTLHCNWLNSVKLSRLCSALDNIWQEQPGQVVVYNWIEWLQTQTFSHLGMTKKLELGPYGIDGNIYGVSESDDRAACGCVSFESDISRLLRHNEEKKNEEFCNATHTCYICFSDYLGKDFVKLPCQHIFCTSCMQTLATVNVKEGSVSNLNCPDTSCRGSIPPYIIKQLVDEEVFQRWENLVLQRSLDAMADIVYCPRCETVCIEEQDNFVQCTQCYYTFCSLCRGSWHVGQECMSAESRLRVIQERQKGSKVGEEQRRKEQNLINEMMNLTYVRREAKQCPTCKMAISKTEGCNKMVCSNCNGYFCFKCGAKIDGYSHFGDGSCNLFEGEEIRQWQPQNVMQQQQAQIELELWPERGKPCPNCRQLNVKMGNNNHLYCWACRTSYCCLCYKVVRRTSEHFGTGPNKCRQHTADQ